MTHLSTDELKAWFEQGRASDRARVISHLAECEACRKALSALAMAAEPDAASPIITVDEAVPRGYAARSVETPRPGFPWLRPIYGFAAAGVVVVGVLWVTTPQRRAEDDTVRSAELSGMSPTGDAPVSAFTFASPFQAASYRLTVRDASGAVVISTTSSTERIAVDDSMRSRLKAGESYSWVVAALDRSGDTIAASKPVRFRYRP